MAARCGAHQVMTSVAERASDALLVPEKESLAGPRPRLCFGSKVKGGGARFHPSGNLIWCFCSSFFMHKVDFWVAGKAELAGLGRSRPGAVCVLWGGEGEMVRGV